MLSRRALLVSVSVAALLGSPARAWIHGAASFPLQIVSASGYGPTSLIAAAITSVSSTSLISRSPFVIGSGDVSQLTLSFFGWYLHSLVGVNTIGNGYTISGCYVEYNGISAQVTFSSATTKAIANGDTDIQSDAILPGLFGVSAFTQGSTGFVRLLVSFSAAQTDHFPVNSYKSLNTSASQILYDPAKCTITNGISGTGALTFTMTGGGIFGTDAVAPVGFVTPIVLGKFTSAGRLPTFMTIGDSIAYGAAEATSNSVFANGYSRDFFPNGVSTGTGAIANLNMGCSGGIGSDWANGSPSLLLAYLSYVKYAHEDYGANAASVPMSTAIFSQLRANGIAFIFRSSLTPFTNSTDSWTTAVNQTLRSGYGPGGSIETFNNALKALVAADFTFLDTTGNRDGGDYWKWFSNGTVNFATADGLHPSSAGYELIAGGNTTVTAQSGVTTNSLRSLFASMP